MTKYIKYKLKTLEPLKILKASSSQNAQYETVEYIPGSSIRGFVINTIIKQNNDFEDYKENLLSDKIRFLNAYPFNGVEMFPSPKCFYESKIEGEKLSNVVINGEFKSGYKRAKLGKFCFFKDEKIIYSSPKLGENVRINIENKDIYRCEYLKKGQYFQGYIAIDDESLEQQIINALKSNDIRIGSSKFSGYGKCSIEIEDNFTGKPFENLSIDENNLETNIYMMLLSNTAMVNKYGEVCGIDEEFFKEKFNLDTIEYCSTSIIQVSNINKTWGSRTPSIPMYESGSIFKLKLSKKPDINVLKNIEDKGIGLKRCEGCGRVIFLKDFEKIEYKEQLENIKQEIYLPQQITKEDKEVLKLIAKGIYMNAIKQKTQEYITNNKIPDGLSNSQLGIILSMTCMLKYQTSQVKTKFENFFEHIATKNVGRKFKEVRKTITQILNDDLESILNISPERTICTINKSELLSDKEIILIKLNLLEDWIKYKNRIGGEDYEQ